MGPRRKTRISPLTGLFGALLSATLQIFLALAPADALADTGFESFASASQVAPSGGDGFVLGGSDPVHDSFDRAFEPGEIFAATDAGMPAIEPGSLSFYATTPAPAGAVARFYRTRAPPFSSFS